MHHDVPCFSRYFSIKTSIFIQISHSGCLSARPATSLATQEGCSPVGTPVMAIFRDSTTWPASESHGFQGLKWLKVLKGLKVSISA